MKPRVLLLGLALILGVVACAPKAEQAKVEPATPEGFQYLADRFADLQVLRYRVPGFDELGLEKKKLLYYLHQAALSGRDIIYDQNYKHNLLVRRTLEAIVDSYTGDRSGLCQAGLVFQRNSSPLLEDQIPAGCLARLLCPTGEGFRDGDLAAR
jgi:hypothetical protein